MSCPQCEALYFNNILMHENGCPLNEKDNPKLESLTIFGTTYKMKLTNDTKRLSLKKNNPKKSFN